MGALKAHAELGYARLGVGLRASWPRRGCGVAPVFSGSGAGSAAPQPAVAVACFVLPRRFVERVQSVLIVEEDAPMRDMMVAMLRGEGLSVSSADTVDAAVEVLQRGVFDAVLSVVGMRGKDGFDLLKLVRALELSTPVILMTSFGDPAVDDRARRAGASGCLSKPFGLEELQAALERAATGPSARASG